ncbi:MAG: hypothetical protein O2983_13155 [Planctomycetota bacterium]|nr:hypothetical protein [Planctomycetota bacterium]MDA0919925.1 hypothetical protein [Planctomycetota bacterium]MDA1160548.1 hypothetical protein [Planctomycetota bacterium]
MSFTFSENSTSTPTGTPSPGDRQTAAFCRNSSYQETNSARPETQPHRQTSDDRQLRPDENWTIKIDQRSPYEDRIRDSRRQPKSSLRKETTRIGSSFNNHNPKRISEEGPALLVDE